MLKCRYIIILLILNIQWPLLASLSPDSIKIHLNFFADNGAEKEIIPHPEYARPRIGLALSGGGARCIPQLGVIEVLKENQIPVDLIVGTSMGSMIGGLYAAGYETDEILQHLKNIDWENVFFDRPTRQNLFLGQKQTQARYLLQLRFSSFKPYIPSGLTPGQTISNILSDLVMQAPYGSYSNFDELKIPFRAVTTDLISGNRVLLENGNLADALCASLAFPLLFTPVVWDSMLLVDGGMKNNIPVQEARELGMDIVIAVDATSNLRNKSEILLPWEIVDQATTIMQREKNQSQKELADFYIRFDIPGQLSTDFSKLDSLVGIGRTKTLLMIDKIKNYVRNREREYLNQIDTTKHQHYKIVSIKIEGLKNINESQIRQAIPFDSLFLKPSGYGDLQNIVAQIYQTGNYKNVEGFLIKENQDYSLIIRVEENPILNNIIFKNNSIYSDSILLKQMNYSYPGIINHYDGQKALIRLLKFYRNNGYSLSHIHSISLNEKGELELGMQEGRVKKINIEGNQKTKAFVILREFPLKVGDVFNYEQIKKGIQNIYGTGLFNTIRLNITYEENQPVLSLKVDEKKFNLIRLGGQYNTERKGNGFIEIVNENIMGTGNPLTLHFQNGERDKRYGLYFRSDRIFKTFLTTQLNIYYQKNKYFSYRGFEKSGEYNDIRTGIDFSLGQQMARWGTISLEASYYYIGYDRLWGQTLHEGELLLNTLALRSVVDTRDQYPFPLKGKYYHFFYELSSANILNSEVSYFKLYSSLENYLSISNQHTFHPKIVWGTSDLTTPLAEQYYLGGEENFLALREHQLNGRHLMFTSLEYRYMLPKIFPLNTYLHFQMNLAGIWGTKVSIKSKDFLFGTEMKLSFLSPLGPFVLAYGRTRDRQQRFYFSAGYDF